MRPDHHDLIGQIGSGNFGDHVKSVLVRLVVKPGLNVQLDFHRDVLFQDANHAVVMFDGERHLRRDFARVLIARAARADKDRAAVRALRQPGQVAAARRHEIVAATIKDGCDTLGEQERVDLRLQWPAAP